MPKHWTVLSAVVLNSILIAGSVVCTVQQSPAEAPAAATGAAPLAATGAAASPVLLATPNPSLVAAAAPASSSAPSLASLCPDKLQPSVSSTIPGAFNPTNQPGADCLAWGDFLGLNWPASPGQPGQPDPNATPADFGTPGPEGLSAVVVWQTYKDESEVFLPSAKAPTAWDAGAPTADCKAPSRARRRPARSATQVLPSARLRGAQELESLSPTQPGGPKNWLADTSSNLVWYEIKINQVEFEYIVNGGLYNAANQWAISGKTGPGINPPTGSMEIKAAWRELTSPSEYTRYLTTTSCVPGPNKTSRYVVLGLVGLHIKHKPLYAANWIWSTFEHVDNAPDANAVPDAGTTYSFYNPKCAPSLIPAACLPADAGPIERGCDGGVPAYGLQKYFNGSSSCGPYPTQVVRQTPIPDTTDNPVGSINKAVQGIIQAASTTSVFQNYELINAMWWSPITDHMAGGAPVPLSQDGLQPGNTNVANTVLETYVQTGNCLGCHVSAPVAQKGDAGLCTADAGCAADYSFAFEHATLPPDAGVGH